MMNYRLLITVLLVAGTGFVAPSCKSKDKPDRVINVEDDDKEMAAAMAKARTGLPAFWVTFGNPTKGEEKFALKVRITDDKGAEHFWVNEIERKDGKVFGIFLTGAVQLAILVDASSALFHLRWGDGWGVAALILAVAAAATGWGILLAAVARTPAQVVSMGSALMLLFGIFGGIFIPLTALPGWMQIVARMSPNAWGSEAFAALACHSGTG